MHEQGRRGAHDARHGAGVGRYGINVNAICPGYIDTEINHHHWQTEAGQKLIDMLPRKRVGKVQDLDALLMMLCAKESHFVNGAVIAGGRRLRCLIRSRSTAAARCGGVA
jgi:NAD(P)-dependent dehydrogenase (short-subunit alcohol dehydrogenase family)